MGTHGKSVRGVLLDIDGTLVESNDAHAHAWVEALAESGHTVAFEAVRRSSAWAATNCCPRCAVSTPSQKKAKR